MPYKDIEKARDYRKEWMRRYRAAKKKIVDELTAIDADEQGYIDVAKINVTIPRIYCKICNKFLGCVFGIAELKCKCGHVNLISTNADMKIESASECQQTVDGMTPSANERLNYNTGGQYGTKANI